MRISTAQFENKSGDKSYNLDVIKDLTEQAARDGSKAIAFHECSITGYTFARHLSKEQIFDLAEFVPEGPSVQRLIEIAEIYDIAILAGLFEKDHHHQIYNTYVCVDKTGLIAKISQTTSIYQSMPYTWRSILCF